MSERKKERERVTERGRRGRELASHRANADLPLPNLLSRSLGRYAARGKPFMTILNLLRGYYFSMTYKSFAAGECITVVSTLKLLYKISRM